MSWTSQAKEWGQTPSALRSDKADAGAHVKLFCQAPLEPLGDFLRRDELEGPLHSLQKRRIHGG